MLKAGTYRTQECDADWEKAEQLCKGKTAEELDKEFEEFKKSFIAEHSQAAQDAENMSLYVTP